VNPGEQLNVCFASQEFAAHALQHYHPSLLPRCES
jgi:hypothetical protein